MLRILERKLSRIRLDKKIEGIDDLHVGHEIDRDSEFGGLLREHQTGEPIAMRILLPVLEMLGREHLEGIALDRRPAMGRRAQADHLRAKADRSIITIAGDVV